MQAHVMPLICAAALLAAVCVEGMRVDDNDDPSLGSGSAIGYHGAITEHVAEAKQKVSAIWDTAPMETQQVQKPVEQAATAHPKASDKLKSLEDESHRQVHEAEYQACEAVKAAEALSKAPIEQAAETAQKMVDQERLSQASLPKDIKDAENAVRKQVFAAAAVADGLQVKALAEAAAEASSKQKTVLEHAMSLEKLSAVKEAAAIGEAAKATERRIATAKQALDLTIDKIKDESEKHIAHLAVEDYAAVEAAQADGIRRREDEKAMGREMLQKVAADEIMRTKAVHDMTSAREASLRSDLEALARKPEIFAASAEVKIKSITHLADQRLHTINVQTENGIQQINKDVRYKIDQTNKKATASMNEGDARAARDIQEARSHAAETTEELDKQTETNILHATRWGKTQLDKQAALQSVSDQHAADLLAEANRKVSEMAQETDSTVAKTHALIDAKLVAFAKQADAESAWKIGKINGAAEHSIAESKDIADTTIADIARSQKASIDRASKAEQDAEATKRAIAKQVAKLQEAKKVSDNKGTVGEARSATLTAQISSDQQQVSTLNGEIRGEIATINSITNSTLSKANLVNEETRHVAGSHL